MNPIKSLVSSTLLALFIFTVNTSVAQDKKVRLSLKAQVSQTIGVDTKITIEYSRPAVKGRTIWGELVPFGLSEGNKYSDNKPYPWRIGANENTTFDVTRDISVEGKNLSAGKYGMHAIPGKDKWTIIFSKKSDLWGSYKYNESEDALRIVVKPQNTKFAEWLTFGFENLAGTSATAYFEWEKLKAPFSVKTID